MTTLTEVSLQINSLSEKVDLNNNTIDWNNFIAILIGASIAGIISILIEVIKRYFENKIKEAEKKDALSLERKLRREEKAKIKQKQQKLEQLLYLDLINILRNIENIVLNFNVIYRNKNIDFSFLKHNLFLENKLEELLFLKDYKDICDVYGYFSRNECTFNSAMNPAIEVSISSLITINAANIINSLQNIDLSYIDEDEIRDINKALKKISEQHVEKKEIQRLQKCIRELLKRFPKKEKKRNAKINKNK